VNHHRPLEGCNILVVEDQYLLATEVCEWLQGAGAKVVGPAPDSRQACALLDSEPVDMAVVDINLGRGPAYEVATRLRERDVPFIFATGYDRQAIPEEFTSAPRLEKPFKERELVAAVGRLGICYPGGAGA
jgi:DNA-binding response OmpR family regulator